MVDIPIELNQPCWDLLPTFVPESCSHDRSLHLLVPICESVGPRATINRSCLRRPLSRDTFGSIPGTPESTGVENVQPNFRNIVSLCVVYPPFPEPSTCSAVISRFRPRGSTQPISRTFVTNFLDGPYDSTEVQTSATTLWDGYVYQRSRA